MKNEKNNRSKSTKKIMRMINIFAVIWITLLLIPTMYLRAKSDIPIVLLYMCLGFVFVGGMVVFQKVLERTRLKGALEEANRECEEEEESMSANDEKPSFQSLAVIAAAAAVITISDIVCTVQTIISKQGEGLTLEEYLPQCANALTLLLCCTFIAVILYNVSKKRIFNSRNSWCIYGVGTTIIISTITQAQYWESTPMLPNQNVQIYYMLFGILIIFFGRLFDIAVKLKNEQDLTI